MISKIVEYIDSIKKILKQKMEDVEMAKKKVLVKIKMMDGFHNLFPKKAHSSDAGYDFYSREDLVIKSKEIKLVKTGVFMEIPVGYELQIRPRSGLALKNWITVENTPGTIDSSYRGEIGIILKNDGECDYHVELGARIAQGVFCELPNIELEEVDELSDSDRGSGGFGSSGIK